ncbi:hypothetical protein [Fructobacillus durionis]|uniref:Uncharacterized protein n=1 Tax=Fructobacillus durionis TaxID=283737 RepID=A0A1I1E660_9LACO|nr:hypothetical protein [Fructobacillus durionis]SFB82689.1 hypothetical protein SAMN05660453_0326 [Fructobacillus durionis]
MQVIKEHLSRKRAYYITGLFIAVVVVVVVAFVLGQQSSHTQSEVVVNKPSISQQSSATKDSEIKSESAKVAQANGDQNNQGKG